MTLAGKGAPSYVIHYAGGGTSEAMDLADVRGRIESRQVTLNDRVSRNGARPVEFFQLDELVDLWDVEDDGFDGRFTPPEATPVPPAPSAPSHAAALPAGRLPSFQGVGPSLATMRTQSRPVASPSSPPEEPQAKARAQEYTPPSSPAVNDPLAALLAVLDDQIENTGEHAAAAALGSDDTSDTPPDEAAAPSGDVPAVPAAYTGYDPLADQVLDPATVLELLEDSNLYTVLAVRPDAPPEQLHARYLARRELLAARQRRVGRTDPEQVRALEGIRRLVFTAYETLSDGGRRTQYDQTRRSQGGHLPPAAQYFSQKPQQTAADLIEESLVDLDSGPPEPPADHDLIDIENDIDAAAGAWTPPPDYDEEGLAELLAEAANEVDADERNGIPRRHSSSDGPAAVPNRPKDLSLPAGLRVYTNVVTTLETEASDPSKPVGEIFTGKAKHSEPERVSRTGTYTRDAVALRRTAAFTEVRKTLSGEVIRPLAGYPSGLEWAVEEDPLRSVRDALAGFAAAFLLPLVLVLVTSLGEGERNFAAPSLWFWLRGVLLIGLAVAGTVWMRREPVSRLGLFPAPLEIIIGLAVGTVLGLAASRVAPVHLEEGAPVGLVLVAMFFMAISHEVFFRGYVTRVLLIGFRSPLPAMALGCVAYGLFYLSYLDVLAQPGFYLFYYSVLLYGVGLGGILALLYWKSHSIWPSVVTHALMLAFAWLMAP